MRKYIIATILFCSIITFGVAQEGEVGSATDITIASDLAKKHLKEHNIPGMAISVSKGGKLLWSEGFGFSNIEIGRKVNPAVTQFRIASISKSLTALALAKLMDEDRLDLDESLYTYLPRYPKKKHDFTLRQIGGHLAGIRHYNGNEFLLNEKMSITEGLDIFKNDSLLFEPGTRYKYSTYGWNLLSEVIQKIAGSPFNDYMEETIFKPLRMYATTQGLSDRLMPNRTQFYRKKDDGSVVLGPEVSNEHKVAGGGFLATSEDLIRFGNEIISPTLVSKETLSELLETQYTIDGKATNYGVGFGIGKSSEGTIKYRHTGGGVGATTVIELFPEEQLVIVMVMNLSQAPGRKLLEKLESLFIK